MVGGALNGRAFLQSRWSAVLAPLGWLYAAVGRLRVWAYQHGWKTSVRPPWPTLSIGNIAVGGTGKTPFLFHTLAWLQQQGAEVGVLSRGYGGDEGRILENRFPAAHLVEGADRVAGLKKFKQRQPQPEVLLLDDGFQHLRLRRDLDVVLLDALHPFGRCLPAGFFRESAASLQRADLIILSRASLVEAERRDWIWRQVEDLRGQEKPFPRIEGDVKARVLRNLQSKQEIPIKSFANKKVVLAAGIGNHDSFLQLVQAAGIEVENYHRLPDHYAWSMRDRALLSSPLPVLVTEKDGVKLRPFTPKNCWEVCVDWYFQCGEDEWNQRMEGFYLPVRAGRIEPLWAAADPRAGGVP